VKALAPTPYIKTTSTTKIKKEKQPYTSYLDYLDFWFPIFREPAVPRDAQPCSSASAKEDAVTVCAASKTAPAQAPVAVKVGKEFLIDTATTSSQWGFFYHWPEPSDAEIWTW
jgi:hypothetical protein